MTMNAMKKLLCAALALTSVPEPATASLGLLGLSALLLRRRRN